MGEFSSIVGVLRCIVNRLWNKLSMGHVIASQFVRDNLTWLAFMFTPIFGVRVKGQSKNVKEMGSV